jgi:hypothetical protein
MPKGRYGCFACGAPTTDVFQVWLRDYRADVAPCANGCRRERTIDSVTRHLCAACGAAWWDRAIPCLARDYGSRGCAYCGDAPTFARVQLWHRRRDGTSVRQRATSFCEECSLNAYGAVAAIFDPDGSWRADGSTVGGDLAAARKRARAKLDKPPIVR